MDAVARKISSSYSRLTEKHSRNNKRMPIYQRLFTVMKAGIRDHELPAGILLPPSRELASLLSVSRSSVIKSYDMLVLEGYVEARQGSGYRVSDKGVVNPSPEQHTTTVGKVPDISALGQSFTQNVNLINSTDNKNIAFRPGLPPLDLFPVNRWKSLANQYWRFIKLSALTYSPSSGLDRLKSNLAKYLQVSRNMHCDPQQVIIVSGSLQSLFLCGMALLNPGDGVVMENPTFPNVISIFKGLQADLLPMPVDQHGGRPADIVTNGNKPVKLIHTTPSCHYPYGYRMSLQRKVDLLQWASAQGSFIIENDYEHEVNNASSFAPTLFSMDKENRTIYLSTFNRLLHPSIRIGFMVVPHYLLQTIEALLKHSHRFVPPSVQIVLNDFIERSFLHQHIKEVLAAATHRQHLFEQAWASQHVPSITLQRTAQTSLHTVAPLPDNWNDRLLIQQLEQNGVVCHSLSKCFVTEYAHQGMIFGYAAARENSIPQKISIVADTLRSCRPDLLD